MKENNAKRHTYEIVVRGHLDGRFAGWFESMTLNTRPDGTTTLCGQIADQTALHGHLSRIRDLGLVLLAVRCLEAADGEGA